MGGYDVSRLCAHAVGMDNAYRENQCTLGLRSVQGAREGNAQ